MSQPLLLRSDSYLSQDSQISCFSMCADDVLGNMSVMSDSQNNSNAGNRMLDFSQILQISDSQIKVGRVKSSQDFASFFSPVKPLPPTRNNEKGPEQLFQRFAPGLEVFNVGRGFRFFDYGQLNLETHFNYHARNRLRSRGLSEMKIDRLVTDPYFLIETLCPSSASSILIYNQRDYTKIMDYLFLSITLLGQDNAAKRPVIVKGFNCLLLNYGFSWKLTLELWMLVWFNYRADPRLLADPTFYEIHLGGGPAVRRIRQTRARRKGESFTPSLILQTLGFIKNLVVKGRLDLVCFNDLKQVFWMLAVTILHKDLTFNTMAMSLISDMLAYLTNSIYLTENETLEMGLLLTSYFQPLLLSSCSRNWDTHNIPNWIRVNGLNHPLNILQVLRMVPPSIHTFRLRSVMAFIDCQIVLGANPMKLAYEVNLSDLWEILEEYEQQWEQMKASHTTAKAFLAMINILVQSLRDHIQNLPQEIEALRNLISIVDVFLKSLPPKEAKVEDPLSLRNFLESLLGRWNNLLMGLCGGTPPEDSTDSADTLELKLDASLALDETEDQVMAVDEGDTEEGSEGGGDVVFQDALAEMDAVDDKSDSSN